jgi:MoaA/NifB/PqqE/SkfB family radical SAM enzyme
MIGMEREYKSILKKHDPYRVCKSTDYNWIFNTRNGHFIRWGKTLEDDPKLAPSPEILDIEISTICHQGCEFCYKSNTSRGKNMSFEKFKRILDKFDENLTQVAFGIGDIRNEKRELVHPELYKIIEYTKERGVIPNITINSYRMTEYDYSKLAELCGAIAVSNYDINDCFECVKKLNDAGCKQVNIHQLLAEETLKDCYDLIDFVNSDSRTVNLNAVVFLCLKQTGRGEKLHPVKALKTYKELVTKILDRKVRFGFDSCEANNFLNAVKDHPDEAVFKMVAEPCESSLFSMYINVDGFAFPCSFSEKSRFGVQVDTYESFDKVWNHYMTEDFRKELIENNRNCPIYNLGME